MVSLPPALQKFLCWRLQDFVDRGKQPDHRQSRCSVEGDISKNVAPNIGYMLGKTGSPTQSRDAEIEQYKKTISDLQKRNNLLVGGANSYRGPGNP